MNQEIRTFHPEAFIKAFYTNVQGHQSQPMYQMIQYQWFNQIFNCLPSSQLCLQIGTGPILLFSAYASRKCASIILSDYNVDCFGPISSWLQHENNLYLKDHFDLIAKQQQITSQEVQSRLRKAITMYTKCDLKKDQILQSLAYLKKVDVLITSLCLETAAENLEEYNGMIKKLSKIIKKNGHLVIFGVLEESFYKVGEQTLPCLPLLETDIESALTNNGFQIIMSKAHRPKKIQSNEASDSKGIFCYLAQLK